MSELLTKAIEGKLDAASIVALVGYCERGEEIARLAKFDEAMSAFQAEVPPIKKSRRVTVEHKSGGSHSYGYAELDAMAQTVRPILAKHGLYCFFEITTLESSVKCRAIVRHTAGGQRSSEFEAPVDSTAKMNATQQVGSAQSYARRYAYVAVLGLTVEGEDDDGQGAGGKASGPPISAEQAVELSVLLKETSTDEGKFLAWLKASSLDAIAATDFEKARKLLESKKAKK